MLRAKRKTLIQTAIEGNIVPQRSKSSSDLLLRLGNNKHAKLQQRGKTTPAGRFYFAQTQTTPETYDIQGTVVQRGSTEFLVTNGKARVLRRLVGNEYTYTRLGRQFFNAKKTSYLVHVPAVIKKSFSNSRGREFMVPHNAFMYEQLVLSANLNEAERKEQLKSKVLAFMESNLDRINGRIVLYHDSDPVLYDENGQWTFDEQKPSNSPTERCKPKPPWIDPWEQLLCWQQTSCCRRVCVRKRLRTAKATAWQSNYPPC